MNLKYCCELIKYIYKMNKNSNKIVFITVATTEFEELIKAIDDP